MFVSSFFPEQKIYSPFLTIRFVWIAMIGFVSAPHIVLLFSHAEKNTKFQMKMVNKKYEIKNENLVKKLFIYLISYIFCFHLLSYPFIISQFAIHYTSECNSKEKKCEKKLSINHKSQKYCVINFYLRSLVPSSYNFVFYVRYLLLPLTFIYLQTFIFTHKIFLFISFEFIFYHFFRWCYLQWYNFFWVYVVTDVCWRWSEP